MQSSFEQQPSLARHHTTTSSADLGDLTTLIAAAIDGRQDAWRELYRRYHSMITAIARQFRLSEANVEDVGQTVWLKLVKHLQDLREPRALPGWIATTTRNVALGVAQATQRCEPADPLTDSRLHQVDDIQLDENLYREERQLAVRTVISELRPEHRALFGLLLADPPLPYSEIGRRLGIPVGSIGPTRARCLARLRGSDTLHAISLEKADAA